LWCVLNAWLQISIIAFAIMYVLALQYRHERSNCKLARESIINPYGPNTTYTDYFWVCMPMEPLFWVGLSGQAVLFPVAPVGWKMFKWFEELRFPLLHMALLLQVCWLLAVAALAIINLVYPIRPAWAFAGITASSWMLIAASSVYIAFFGWRIYSRMQKIRAEFRRRHYQLLGPPPGGAAGV